MCHRSGYSRGFIERGELLTLLYNNLPGSSKQSKLLINKRISRIDHSCDAVTVHCRDGSVYSGDILAGADGIHSQARSEMWRASNEADGVIPMSEQKPLNAVFGCLFGISRLIDGFSPSYFDYIPDQGHSIMWAVGKDKIFWYVYYTLPKIVTAGEIRFTDADAENLATSLADCPVMPNGTHCFRDFWESRLTATLLPMEMGEYKHSTWGRFAMLGDAVHKQTVSAGQGANLCIESAAVLTNTIKRLLDGNADHRPSLDQIRTALVSGYQDPRAARVSAYVEAVNEHTALLCKYNLPLKIMQDYVLPWLPPDFGNNFYCDLEVGADMLDFIPPPKAAFVATMPYNKYLGVGHRENLAHRAMWALPFLGLFGLAVFKMDPTNAVPDFLQIVKTGQITWESGVQPVFSSFYGFKPLDDFALLTTTFFAGWELGFDTVGSWHVFTFLVDFGTLYAILLIEACRCANAFSLARL
jgi:2-polyprenyl-6-methoxyphenol hydroxylase-like FAD-dependent oxidoreductase